MLGLIVAYLSLQPMLNKFCILLQFNVVIECMQLTLGERHNIFLLERVEAFLKVSLFLFFFNFLLPHSLQLGLKYLMRCKELKAAVELFVSWRGRIFHWRG